MKKIFILIVLLFPAAICSDIYAQQTPPPVTGDTDLRDTDVKRRSMEIERIEREAKKSNKTSGASADKREDRVAAKYNEIKTDYEQIQMSQDAIIKTYKTGAKINYEQIGKSAVEINNSAKRLNSNLFPADKVENRKPKKEEKQGDKTEPGKSVQDIIIELDNSIGSFVTSPMFQNLRSVDPEVSKRAKLDLEKIIELSALLNAEAQKMSIAGK